MRPTECPKCGRMIGPRDLNCNNCGGKWFTSEDGRRVWIHEVEGTWIDYPNGEWGEWRCTHGNGRTQLRFPNGREVWIHKDGSTSVKFPDGRHAWIQDNGATRVKFPDGREEWIHEDGKMSAEFSDGRTAWINEDGTTEVIEADPLRGL